MGRTSNKSVEQRLAELELQKVRILESSARSAASADPILQGVSGQLALNEKATARAKRGFSGNPSAQFVNQRKTHELRILCINAEEAYRKLEMDFLELRKEGLSGIIVRASTLLAAGVAHSQISEKISEMEKEMTNSETYYLLEKRVSELQFAYDLAREAWTNFSTEKTLPKGTHRGRKARIVEMNPEMEETEMEEMGIAMEDSGT